REEAVGPDGTLPGVAVDDAAREEYPDDEIERQRARDLHLWTSAVEHAAEAVKRRREADDRGCEGRCETRGLERELLPPVDVHAVGDLLGPQASAEMRLDHPAHGDRQRQRRQQCDEE